MKTLVIYVCHELNQRVQYFIDNALFESSEVEFLFVINHPTLKINLPPYVTVINRENIGIDFGGWSEGLLRNNLYKNYTHFIFANHSIMGPYLPYDFKSKWTDIFTNPLNDNVKLFGPTINSCNNPMNESHVQSYIFSMNLETLEFLISKEIFSLTKIITDKFQVIVEREIGMSQLILKNGWNIGCLMDHYQGIDFTFKTQNREIDYWNDIMFPRYINPSEFTKYVFIKGNRFGM
jgi:hypothetical protein